MPSSQQFKNGSMTATHFGDRRKRREKRGEKRKKEGKRGKKGKRRKREKKTYPQNNFTALLHLHVYSHGSAGSNNCYYHVYRTYCMHCPMVKESAKCMFLIENITLYRINFFICFSLTQIIQCCIYTPFCYSSAL